jgi:hypothetical protein
MDPKLVAIIEDYARTHGLNLPPHQIVSDLVASGPSGIEQLLAMLGMSINAGDPADNAAAKAGQAGREALVDDALTKFPANEEESAAQLAGVAGQDPMSQLFGLTQAGSGIGQGIAGALSGMLQPFSQLGQQLPQLAQQALQTGMGALQQGAGSAAAAAEEVPGELLGDGLGGAGAGLAGTMPAAMLGPPPTPSAGTVPASSPAMPPPPPSTPEPRPAPGGGMAGMPMMPPGAMGGGASGSEAKADTKRIVGPSVKNGAPVQGRITVPPSAPEVIKRVQGKPVAARRILAPDPKPDDVDADPGR